ncbi:hypothetical protein L7F22_027504 [Adiantum nelumboides]|nr:hypothetical protein [Adiantum nelumboides]
MMKLRQQQQLEGTIPIHISKRIALPSLNKTPFGGERPVKEGFFGMLNHGASAYERDESPVSVISHSATIVSQPSSACTSMEHHLNQLIGNPNRQRIANHNKQSPLSQSVGTSGASTSEDDSSANYALPTLLIAVSPEQEESPSQQEQELAYSSKGLSRKILKKWNHSEQFAPKASKRSPHDSEVDQVAPGSFNSDDNDDSMISIDLQGFQEDPIVLRDKHLKSYGNKMTDEEQKHGGGNFLAMSKHYDGEVKEEHCKLNRTTSNPLKEVLLVRPIMNQSVPKVLNDADNVSNSRTGAALNVRKVEEGRFKGPQKLSSTMPSLVSRQRSVNSTKLAVPSKWDDAEKWLCYDNSHKVKSASISRQTSLTSNHSTSSSGGRMASINRQLSGKEDYASPSRGGLCVNDKASECRSDQSSPSEGKLGVRKAYECKDNGAHSVLARHSVLQNTIAASDRGAQYILDATSSRGTLACSSQSSSLTELVENGSRTYGYLDTLRCKWNEIPMNNACQKSVSDYMSSGEIANPRCAPNHKLAAVSMSDGEISQQINCQQGFVTSHMSASAGMMPREKRTKDSTRPASMQNWIRSSSDVLETPCKYDNVNSRASQQDKATGISASDGEVCEIYASDQQFKGSASYTKRVKQHQILQKLRIKCSPRRGAYASTPLCKAEEKVGGDMTSTNGCLQNEFMVQTPTHGRSSSMKDACTEVSPSLSRRDIGTQMTPPASSPITSKCTSPLQNTSPARHNTPTHTSPTSNRHDDNLNASRESDIETKSRCDSVSGLVLESDHWAKLELREPPSGAQSSEKDSELYTEWSPDYGLEEETVDSKGGSEGHCGQDEVHSGGIVMKSAGVLETRAAIWEEAERAKFNAKFKREEARIKTWENLQKAKAEADLKKLEVKLERLRSKATEKVMSRMAAAQKRAEEMRAAAETQQAEHIKKLRERACSLRRNALFPGGFAVCFARNHMP